MILRKKSWLLILSGIIFFSSAQLSKQEAEKRIWQILKRNNPDAYDFMKQLDAIPRQIKTGNTTINRAADMDFMFFVRTYTIKGILNDIGTAVHETNHFYESNKAYAYVLNGTLNYKFGEKYSVYFISSKEEYLVHQTDVFVTKEMADDIPEAYRSSRFNTYVGTGNEDMSSQKRGVYGLMNEWTAYYNGFKTNVRNLPEYDKLAKADVQVYLDYISSCSSPMVAYYEFKYYILHYLFYAKKNYPKVYEGILNNKPFVKAWNAVDKAYAEQIALYRKNLDLIEGKVRDQDGTFERKKGFLYIGNRGVGVFQHDITALEEALAQKKYEDVLRDLRKNKD